MSENRINSQDVVQDDIFGNAKKSSEEFTSALLKMDKALTDIAGVLNGNLQKSYASTLAEMKRMRAEMNAVNKAYEDAIAVENEKLGLDREDIKNAIQQSRLRQQESRERQQLNREQQQVNKQQEREQKLNEKANSTYQKLLDKLNATQKEYRELAVRKAFFNNLSQKEELRLATLEKRQNLYRKGIESVNESMGKYQHKVGQYKQGNEQLTQSLNYLIRDMNGFGNSIQTGIMGISNNIDPFIDQLRKVSKEGGGFKAAITSLGSSLLSFTTVLSVTTALFTIFGPKLIEYVSTLFEGSKQLNSYSYNQRRLNKEINEGNKYVGEQSAKFVGLIATLKETNKGSKERADLIKEINDNYGSHIKNIKDETLFQAQLNKVVADYIEFKRQEFQIKLNEDKIALNLSKQEKINQEILKIKKQITYYDNLGKDIQDKTLGSATFGAYDNLKDKLKLQEAYLSRLNERLKTYGLNISDATDEMNKLGFSTGKNNEKMKELDDLSRQIRDEQIKRIKNERKREIDALRASYDDRKDDVKKTYALASQKNQLLIELDKTYLDDLRKLYDKYQEEDIKKQQAYEDEKLRITQESRSKMADEINKILDEDFESSRTKAELDIIQTEKNEEKRKRKLLELRRDQLKQDIQLAKDGSNEQLKLKKELALLEEDIDKQALEAKKKQQQKIVDTVKNTLKELSDIEEARLNGQIAQLDTYIEARKNYQNTLKDLANQGNIEASQSIALENEQIAKATADKMKAEKKLQDLKMFTAVINAFANSGNVGKTLSDVGQLLGGTKALLSTIPSYDVGTDNTGQWNDAGLDGKGGRLGLFHPNEMILNSKQTSMVGDNTAQEVAEVMYKHNTGKLVENNRLSDSAGNSYQLLNAINELNSNIMAMPKDEYKLVQLAHDALAFDHIRKTKNITQQTRYIRR